MVWYKIVCKDAAAAHLVAAVIQAFQQLWIYYSTSLIVQLTANLHAPNHQQQRLRAAGCMPMQDVEGSAVGCCQCCCKLYVDWQCATSKPRAV